MTRRAALLAPLAFLLVQEAPYLVSGVFLAGSALALTASGIRGQASRADSELAAFGRLITALLHAATAAFIPVVAASILFLDGSTGIRAATVVALLTRRRDGSAFVAAVLAPVALLSWVFNEQQAWLIASIIASLALAPLIPEHSTSPTARMRACATAALAGWGIGVGYHQMLDPSQLISVFALGLIAGVPLPAAVRAWVRPGRWSSPFLGWNSRASSRAHRLPLQ